MCAQVREPRRSERIRARDLKQANTAKVVWPDCAEWLGRELGTRCHSRLVETLREFLALPFWLEIETQTRANRIELLKVYVRFLILRAKDADLSPLPWLDTIWHSHLLETENYATCCFLMVGRTIAHSTLVPGGPLAQAPRQEALREIYQRTYKEVLQTYPLCAQGPADDVPARSSPLPSHVHNRSPSPLRLCLKLVLCLDDDSAYLHKEPLMYLDVPTVSAAGKPFAEWVDDVLALAQPYVQGRAVAVNHKAYLFAWNAWKSPSTPAPSASVLQALGFDPSFAQAEERWLLYNHDAAPVARHCLSICTDHAGERRAYGYITYVCHPASWSQGALALSDAARLGCRFLDDVCPPRYSLKKLAATAWLSSDLDDACPDPAGPISLGPLHTEARLRFATQVVQMQGVLYHLHCACPGPVRANPLYSFRGSEPLAAAYRRTLSVPLQHWKEPRLSTVVSRLREAFLAEAPSEVARHVACVGLPRNNYQRLPVGYVAASRDDAALLPLCFACLCPHAHQWAVRDLEVKTMSGSNFRLRVPNDTTALAVRLMAYENPACGWPLDMQRVNIAHQPTAVESHTQPTAVESHTHVTDGSCLTSVPDLWSSATTWVRPGDRVYLMARLRGC